MFYQTNHAFFTISKFIFTALLLFAGFRFLQFLFPLLLKNDRYRKIAIKYFPFLEFSIWILFFIWVVEYFMKADKFISGGILILMLSISVWASWFALKDYISGLIIRLSSDLSLNDNISVAEKSGKIHEFRFRTLSLKTSKNKTINIPYSKILNEEIIKSNETALISGHSLSLNVKKKTNVLDTVKEIKETILLLPWISTKEEPKITLVSEDEKNYVFDIVLFSFKKRLFHKTKNILKQKFS